MADMMRVKDAAKLWGITERRVIALCQKGKIKGAVKNGRAWELPANAEKPADSRIKTGAYIQAPRPTNLPLPIGVSDYRLASTEYYKHAPNARCDVKMRLPMFYGIYVSETVSLLNNMF